ncbi:MAG: hypothetical protein JNM93_01640 [Bacteriovoracaceae bacterium]|nr:hypothetical protein [Bacteriovoracaceae bacterium]
MKIVITTLLAVTILSACSHQSKYQADIETYEYKHYEEIKSDVFAIIDSHNEYSPETKTALKKVLGEGFDKGRALRIEESQTSQYFLETLLSDEKDGAKLNALKSQMKKVYSKKYDNLVSTANELKKILGIKGNNSILMREVNPYMIGR